MCKYCRLLNYIYLESRNYWLFICVTLVLHIICLCFLFSTFFNLAGFEIHLHFSRLWFWLGAARLWLSSVFGSVLARLHLLNHTQNVINFLYSVGSGSVRRGSALTRLGFLLDFWLGFQNRAGSISNPAI